MTPKPNVTTTGRLRRVPNQPKTPQRSFRIPDDLYQRAQAKADEGDENMSDVVRRLLLEWVEQEESPEV